MPHELGCISSVYPIGGKGLVLIDQASGSRAHLLHKLGDTWVSVANREPQMNTFKNLLLTVFISSAFYAECAKSDEKQNPLPAWVSKFGRVI